MVTGKPGASPGVSPPAATRAMSMSFVPSTAWLGKVGARRAAASARDVHGTVNDLFIGVSFRGLGGARFSDTSPLRSDGFIPARWAYADKGVTPAGRFCAGERG